MKPLSSARQLLASFALCITLMSTIGLPTEVTARVPYNTFVYPLLGTRISSTFGNRNHPVKRFVRHHNGIDLAAPEGATIRTIAAGRVVYADPYAGYGNLVVVQHKNGLTSHYGHCQSFRVKPGQSVSAGEIIGTVGKTGVVTGPHLHFEIRINGAAQDPEKFIPDLAGEAQG